MVGLLGACAPIPEGTAAQSSVTRRAALRDAVNGEGHGLGDRPSYAPTQIHLARSALATHAEHGIERVAVLAKTDLSMRRASKHPVGITAAQTICVPKRICARMPTRAR